ncbi:DUF1905 domain-containing protein [Candidatus Nomurabacteria bacterium]|nr:DUF1905 domain-containing protein [Candidatus Nomurabacteria bacterium]
MALIKIKSKIWLYPGLGGWHFVTLDKKLSEKIKNKHKKGFVKIEAKVGKSTWNTSLFPHSQSKSYLLCIKSSIRKSEGLLEGDEVSVSIKIL